MVSLDISRGNAASLTPVTSAVPADTRRPLVGLTRAEIAGALNAIGVADSAVRMRANQIWHWIYVRGATDFAPMTTIARDLRDELARHFTLARPEVVDEQVSSDGTRKWLLRMAPGVTGAPGPEIETVYIPEETRGTLCVSSQVGCTLTCSF